LRKRPEDIPLFVEHFLSEFTTETASGALATKEGAQAVLGKWDVSELKNLIERHIIMTP